MAVLHPQVLESQDCWEGLEDVGERILESIWHARKPSTIRQYCYALRKFFEYRLFCAGDLKLPIDAVSACDYLSYLKDSEASCGAVKMALNAMKWAHNFVPGLNQYNDPLDEKIVRRVYESALRAIKPNRNIKAPLSKEIINNIFDHLQENASLSDCRDALIVTLAFALLLRHDEISHLCCSHLEQSKGNIKVKIISSKTDNLRNGRVMWLAEGRTSRLLDRYLTKASLSYGQNHFLFGPIRSFEGQERVGNEKLAYNTYRLILKRVLEKQEVDPTKFGFHSCRSGGATELAQDATQYELMTAGRWKDQRSLAHYVEVPVGRRLHLSKSLDNR